MSQEKSVPKLSELSDKQREEAYERYKLIRACLEEEVTQTELARESGVPLKTLQRWIRRYRQDGLRGLARLERSDKGKQRGLTEEQVKVVEGLALRKPRRTVVTIQRQVNAIALEQGWREASYGQVRQIVEKLSPALQTLAHEGAETYREEYDLLYRREAKGPNEIWQADHCLLPIWIRDEDGREG
ncbi:MAG: helix-turn-helix domain containing protein, partial [Chloroflexi bacterium]